MGSMGTTKLTQAQLDMLRDVYSCGYIAGGVRAAHGTARLTDRGLIEPDPVTHYHRLTDAGRAALEAAPSLCDEWERLWTDFINAEAAGDEVAIERMKGQILAWDIRHNQPTLSCCR